MTSFEDLLERFLNGSLYTPFELDWNKEYINGYSIRHDYVLLADVENVMFFFTTFIKLSSTPQRWIIRSLTEQTAKQRQSKWGTVGATCHIKMLGFFGCWFCFWYFFSLLKFYLFFLPLPFGYNQPSKEGRLNGFLT